VARLCACQRPERIGRLLVDALIVISAWAWRGIVRESSRIILASGADI